MELKINIISSHMIQVALPAPSRRIYKAIELE